MKAKYFIFDLDDTLFYEIDFLISAYKEIARTLGDENLYITMFQWFQEEIDVFAKIETLYKVSKIVLIHQYRQHNPTIVLNDGAEFLLKELKREGHYLGLISDGRSLTQRNKLKALRIENLFDKIIISEEFGSSKPDERNFETFTTENVDSYYYIADNTKKDFLVPNSLGWTSICLLDSGKNIHKQNFSIKNSYLPKFTITSFHELVKFIK